MKHQRILIIEDEVVVAMDMQAILEEAGATEVMYAATELEALALLDQEHWDAVVADANLHGQPIQAIAAVLLKRHIPFVIVSGYSRENLPEVLFSVPLLSKPIRPQQLVHAVSELFAN
jgi:CheY-like chemotaxis protein